MGNVNFEPVPKKKILYIYEMVSSAEALEKDSNIVQEVKQTLHFPEYHNNRGKEDGR